MTKQYNPQGTRRLPLKNAAKKLKIKIGVTNGAIGKQISIGSCHSRKVNDMQAAIFYWLEDPRDEISQSLRAGGVLHSQFQ